MNKPLPYQQVGIDFLASRATAFLGDDAGLGKSMQMIRAADRQNADRIIVFTPAIGRVSWQMQFAQWDTAGRGVFQYPSETLYTIPDGPLALIVTLDFVSNVTRAAQFAMALRRAQPFQAVFIDEAHGLKSVEANRARLIYGKDLDRANGLLSHDIHGDNLKHIWPASATFTPLHAGELYPHLRALFPEVLRGLWKGKLPNYWQFVGRFCHVRHTNFGDKIEGNNPKAIPYLKEALGPHLLLRRKADVLPQLPALRTETLPLETVSKTDIIEALQRLNVDTWNLPDDQFLDAVAAAWMDPHYSTRRRMLGQLKAEAVLPWVEYFLNNHPDKKLILFAHHVDVIDYLSNALQGFDPVQVTGRTNGTADKLSVDRFMEDPACRLFLGQNRAASTAITLTSADTVLMLEPDPSPSVNYQAISRAHRLGQKSSVRALFACEMNNPIERRLVQVLRRRSKDNMDLFGAEIPGTV